MAYRILDFSDIVARIREELKIQSDDTVNVNRIKRIVNEVYLDQVVPAKRWTWLSGHTDVEHKPYYNDGTVTVTPDSTTITFSVAPSTSKTGYYFANDGFNEIYLISSHTAGATTATLTTPYTGALSSTATFKVWTDTVNLPTDCRETVDVWHDFFRDPMEAVGLQEFRKRVAEAPKLADRPAIYTTYDYTDPSSGDGETESDRYRVMKIWPALHENSTTLHIDYVKEVSPLDLDGDEPALPLEDRAVLVYGALAIAWAAIGRNPEEAARNQALFDRKLSFMMGKLEDGFDKPQIRPDSNYLSRKRGPRLKSMGRGALAGGSGSYTAPSYLSGATINGATITGNLTVNSGVTIDGRDVSADGSSLDSHIAATSGVHGTTGSVVGTSDSQTLTNKTISASSNTITGITNACVSSTADIAVSKLAALTASKAVVTSSSGVLTTSTVTSTELGYVSGVTSAIQTQIDAKLSTTLTSGKIYVGNGSNVATAVTPSGDVTIDNTGVTAIASGVIVNADVNASAAITYSKLSLTGGIVNADVNASAAIAWSKLAALTASRALVSSAGGVLIEATTTAAQIGYLSTLTSDVQTQLDAKVAKSTLTTKGDTYVATGSATVVRQGVGADYSSWIADSTQTNGVRYGMDHINGGLISNAMLSFSASAGALTIALKTYANGDPSSTDPVLIAFQSTTSGQWAITKFSSATSITIPSGATLGHTATPSTTTGNCYVWVYALSNGTLGVSTTLDPNEANQQHTWTAISTASDDNSYYSSSTTSTSSHRVLARFYYISAPNGTWTAPSSGTVVVGPAALVPVREYATSSGTSASWTTTSGQYGDATTLVLPPGTWDLSFNFAALPGASSGLTVFSAGINTTAGNSGSGLSTGINNYEDDHPTATSGEVNMASISTYIVSPTTTTTYRLKQFASYTGTLNHAYYFKAERVGY